MENLEKENLEKKGYIEWTKSFYADIDIRLLDNSFVVDGETVYEEYIDLNVAVFRNEKLYTCRGGAIRCLLYFYKRISSQKAVTMASSIARRTSLAIKPVLPSPLCLTVITPMLWEERPPRWCRMV